MLCDRELFRWKTTSAVPRGGREGQSSLWSEQCELSVWRAVPGVSPTSKPPEQQGCEGWEEVPSTQAWSSLFGTTPRAAANQPRTFCVHVMAQDAGNFNCPCFILKNPTTCILAMKLGSIKG